MSKQRLKMIRAGRLVREALWSASFPSDPPKARAEKARCSTAARQRINDRYSWQKLKMMLAANFTYADLMVTLTYDDEHLPRTKEDARKCLKKFFALLRKHRKSRGLVLHYIYCTEDKHGDGRIHHHVVLNGTGQDYELIHSLWEYGSDLHFAPVEAYGYEELAKYLTKEPREYGHTEVGTRAWIPSMGLKKPETPPTQWVDGSVRLEPPLNAHILRRESFKNEWGEYAYIEYLLPAPPAAKHTRPGKQKKNTASHFSSLEHCILSGKP